MNPPDSESHPSLQSGTRRSFSQLARRPVRFIRDCFGHKKSRTLGSFNDSHNHSTDQYPNLHARTGYHSPETLKKVDTASSSNGLDDGSLANSPVVAARPRVGGLSNGGHETRESAFVNPQIRLNGTMGTTPEATYGDTADLVVSPSWQDGLPSEPGQNDKLYNISLENLPLGPLPESTDFLAAPVGQTGPEIDSNRTIRDFMNQLANDIKVDGAFRRVHVRYDGDPQGERARVQHIMHDTGAGVSLTFEHKLVKLGLDFERADLGTLTSVTGQKFQPIGMRHICFSYYGLSDKKYWTNLLVLQDPEHGKEPAWDMLFGRDTILKTKALTWNHKVIGIHTVGYVYSSSNKSPRISFCDKVDEEIESITIQKEHQTE